jgi:F420H(2)-dependent quinone reductase
VADVQKVKADVQKAVMRAAVAVHNRIYRASGGRLGGTVRGVPVLLLTVAGRRTGKPHTTPVAYLDSGGRYVVSGTAGGSPTEPQWFRNLRHADRAVVQVGPRQVRVTVEIAPPAERDMLWEQLVARAPSCARYRSRTGREMPVAVLTPVP